MYILFKKTAFLLSKSQKKELIILLFLLIIGIFFEMLGLGILLPALTIMLDSDIGSSYPVFKPYLNYLGNPSQLELIVLGMSAVLFVYLLKALFLSLISWKQSKFTAYLSAALSERMFNGYLNQPYTFHIQRNSAELLRNIQVEVVQLCQATQGVLAISVELSMILGVSLTLIYIEPIGALSVMFFMFISAGIFYLLIKKKMVIWGTKRQFHVGKINKHLLQGLSGVKDIILSNKQNHFTNEFSEHNYITADVQSKVVVMKIIPRLYLEVIAVAGLSIVIILIVIQEKPLETLIPIIGIFVAAAFRMLPSVNRIITALQQIQFVKPVVNVLYDEFVLIENRKKSFIKNVCQSEKSFNFGISLKNIDFKYPNSKLLALQNINLNIDKGETVGIIGDSGSGKTTLMDLILGLLKPDSGKIIIDKNEIKDTLEFWKNKIGYVPQSIYLIDDSLRNNIAFGIPKNEINETLINQCIKDAQLTTLIDQLPEGLDTIVGERGVRLSGGQCQRIGIARALYNNPDLLVLDEATSSLDETTEKEFMKAIDNLHGKKTILIVAHRLSTVKNCNRLYKLEKGQIIGVGSPVEVLDLVTNNI